MLFQNLFQASAAKSRNLPLLAGFEVIWVKRERFISYQACKLNHNRQRPFCNDIVFYLKRFQSFFIANHVYSLRNLCQKSFSKKSGNRHSNCIAHRFVAVIIATWKKKTVWRSHQSSRLPDSQEPGMDFAILLDNQILLTASALRRPQTSSYSVKA